MKTLKRIERYQETKSSYDKIHNRPERTLYVTYECRQCNHVTGPIHTCCIDGITYHAENM